MPRGTMMIRVLYRLVILIAVAVGAQSNSVADDSQGTDFHGFHIDTHLMNESQKSSVLPTVVEQLMIVESVGLPDNVVNFFRKIPLLVDPTLQFQPGMYLSKGSLGVVKVQPILFPQNKPILLHEFLHAYHIKVLTVENQDVLTAYNQALRSADYPARFRSAHFLENPLEYFAVMGTIYLFGTIQQPPFDCVVMSKSQPEYLAFMAKEFGDHECK